MTPQEILKQYFGYETFHPGQARIIDAILSGRDALAVMPTGAGKSICYQVPALLLGGITLVISPLISLMQDQVKGLNEAGVHAAYINSSLSETQIRKALRFAMEGVYKIIYVAPERLMSEDFLLFAREADISMVTVDEAHCISQWGQDFRPSYLRIVDFVRELPARPILSAFTATATEEVREDISCSLGLNDALVLVSGFDRPNLYFEVSHTKKKDDFVLDYIRQHESESGIIYCATRKNVDQLYALLGREGINVSCYHAGMGSTDRKYNQEEFVYDHSAVMVATNAFGMGIDKSNVRYVIHYNMPQSMENYYQEAGRAGRDGERAACILLFAPQDVMINRYLLEKKSWEDIALEDIANIEERDRRRLRVMEHYCQTTECLRSYILRYFGEKPEKECQNCSNCLQDFQEEDVTETAKQIINCVTEARGQFGINIITGTLVGANRARLREVGSVNWRSYGKCADMGEGKLKEIIPALVQKGYLIQTVSQYSVLKVGPNIRDLKNEDVRVKIRVRAQAEQTKRDLPKKAGRGSDHLTKLGYCLFDELKGLRMQIAREQNLPPYIVFTDKTLMEMCVKLPEDEAAMLDVSGVAKVKFSRYGEQFLDAIRRFREMHPGEVISTYSTEQASTRAFGAANQAASQTASGAVHEDGQPAAADEGRAEDQDDADAQSIGGKRKKTGKSRKKAEFAISREDALKFVYGDLYYATEIKDHLNKINTATDRKKLTGTAITAWLQEEGLVLIRKREDGFTERSATPEGTAAGVVEEEKVSPAGVHYTLLKYPRNVQEMVVRHFTVGQGDGAPVPEFHPEFHTV